MGSVSSILSDSDDKKLTTERGESSISIASSSPTEFQRRKKDFNPYLPQNKKIDLAFQKLQEEQRGVPVMKEMELQKIALKQEEKKLRLILEESERLHARKLEFDKIKK